jgi:hypothetical protein
VCATETKTDADIARYAFALAELISTPYVEPGAAALNSQTGA